MTKKDKTLALLIVLLAIAICFADSGCKPHIAGPPMMAQDTAFEQKPDTSVLTPSIDTSLPPQVFHIKAIYFYANDYALKYTFDNWKTEDYIHETFDISGRFMGNAVIYNPKLFNGPNCEENLKRAIDFGNSFHSIQSVKLFEARVYRDYHRLLAYRNAHPIKKQDDEDPPKPICAKEFIIK